MYLSLEKIGRHYKCIICRLNQSPSGGHFVGYIRIFRFKFVFRIKTKTLKLIKLDEIPSLFSKTWLKISEQTKYTMIHKNYRHNKLVSEII